MRGDFGIDRLPSAKKRRVARLLLAAMGLIFAPTLFAQQSLVHLGPFLPDQSGPDRALAAQIAGDFTTKLQAIGFRVEPNPGNALKERLATAKSAGAALLVEGYYRSSAPDRNLSLYGLVYNVQTGFLIDAVAVIDDIEVLRAQGVPIRLDELREPDERRLRDFEERFIIRVRSNPRFAEAHEQVVENVINPGLAQRYSLPVQKEDVKQQASEVFNMLASQVTTSSTKVATQVLDAPAVLNIVSAQEIIGYGWKSINEVLYHLPGFSPSQDYDRRTVSSRGTFEGWNNNHYLMLMDGVQFNDILYGTAYTWEITPINLIKSLEVIRGPGSALYGSNATNGVIAIHTYSGEDLGGRLVVRLRSGDAGTHTYDFMTGNKGQYFSYVLSYNDFRTGGNTYNDYDGSGRLDAFGYDAKFPVRDQRTNNYFMLKIQGEDFLKGLTVQYHRQYWDFQTGHGWIWRIPDFSEAMSESIQNAFISYNSKLGDKLSQEYVIGYQKHDIDWNTRYAESNSYAGYYPQGATEYLKTGAEQYFARAQITYTLPTGGSALAGLEAKDFIYRGDKEHYANFNATDSANLFPPFSDNAYHPLGPWLQWIKGRQIPTYSAFAQVVSGKLLDKHVEVTIGTRYDKEVVKFNAIDQPYNDLLGLPKLVTLQSPVAGYPTYYSNYPSSDFGFPYQPEQERQFRRTSPRAGLVFLITKDWSVKFLTGKAFRAPSITELFGANTFSLASNPRKLQPEVIRTSEVATDWVINRYFNFRANVFKTRFENQIGYSVQNNNLSTNIYTLATVGGETELLFGTKTLGGFVNYSINKRVGENVLDATIARSPDQTTWSPSRTASAGGHATLFSKFDVSVNAEHQGKVYRRVSDYGVVDPITGIGPLSGTLLAGGTYQFYDDTYPNYRPRVIKAWTDMGARLVYNINELSQFGVSVTNMFNSAQTLIKNFNYPFDYHREERRYLVELNVTL